MDDSPPGFSPMAEAFSRFVVQLSGAGNPQLALVAKLSCEAIRCGHVCLDLNALINGQLPAGLDLPELQTPGWTLAEWLDALTRSQVVGPPGSFHPLILDDAHRIYLYRYWRYEQDLAQGLLDRSGQVDPPDSRIDTDRLNRYFPESGPDRTNWQKVAAVLAATRKLCVISGGPGTGKTTTVVKILALLLDLADDQPLAIALAAPTGKAAARLNGAISRAKSSLPVTEALCRQIPEQVHTLHRLLGSIHHSPRFRFNRERRLPFDVVVVDEASMVDLPLMAKLVSALPDQARLILLGDKHQLASVEAGAVLGEICQTGSESGYSAQLRRSLAGLVELPPQAFAGDTSPGLGDCLVTLHQNYRFHDTSGIGRLSRLLNAGDAEGALNLLADPKVNDADWRDLPSADQLQTLLADRIVAGFAPYLTAGSVLEALEKFHHFMVLGALRDGPYGVSNLNALCEKILVRQGLLEGGRRWYKGRPIMITANDYRLGLFNGDTGLLWPEPCPRGELKAHFMDADGRVRSLAPSRLPAHTTFFASTVHKSQGSEFDTILLLLPPYDCRPLTRELVYTGATRARSSLQIWGNKQVLAVALQRTVERHSGLRDALWGGRTQPDSPTHSC